MSHVTGPRRAPPGPAGCHACTSAGVPGRLRRRGGRGVLLSSLWPDTPPGRAVSRAGGRRDSGPVTAGRQIPHAAADTTSPAGGGLRAGGRILAGETLGCGSGTEDETRMAVIDRVSRSARARPGRAGWVIAAGSATVLAVLFAWPATRYALTSADPTNVDPLVAFTLGFGVVGALILSRVGSNALGWLYAGAGGWPARSRSRCWPMRA